MSEQTNNQASNEAENTSDAPATPSKDECTIAMLCYLLAIFTWPLGPLIIWLVKKDESAFVDDQGKEALNFEITILIVAVVAGCLTFIVFGLGAAAVWVVKIIFNILAAIEANKGVRYRYPFALRLIK